MRLIANIYNSRGIRLEEAGDEAAAIRAYRQAIKWDRRWSVPWFNLGLMFKRRGRWHESLTHNERAVELNPSDEGAWWNLGIAATGLGNWQRAREAWKSCGIDVPDGEGPPEMDFGTTPIRLNPSIDAEVVWCKRIDPARAVILSVPLPESAHRCGDVVLHDGARNGSRVFHGVEVPVFDELQLLQPSPLGTFIIRLAGVTASEAEELTQAAAVAGVEAEDWTANIQSLCKNCSEGKVDHAHGPVEDSTNRIIGIAATSDAAIRSVIEPLIEAVPSAVIETIDCALPPLPIQ
jgi:hypothetical protein